ncbi:MAG: Crp/Fnr family transcriptional regulator [Telmatospirillum sp.]|nr:Crp/Fnr family transcriptional regulator [Telmatospirillum sp.]
MTCDPSWLSGFPPLSGLGSEARALLAGGARQTSFAPGAVLFREGAPCESFLLLLDGRIRIQKVGPSGREIVLYRVTGGESCFLTTSCLMAGEAYSAEGVAETPVRAAILPASLFQRLLGLSPEFRRFVFGACGERLADLLCLVQEMAFVRIDVRLARALLGWPASQGVIRVTHQQLAAELGSAREVISRQLKTFERQGWVELNRGSIRLCQPDALQALCQGGDGA